MSVEKKNKQNIVLCFHCNDVCKDLSVSIDDKYFCCQSCKIVYEILNENNLCKYYDLEDNPGISPAVRSPVKYEYLDDEKVLNHLILFNDKNISLTQLYIPQMHCSSCIWLLENLYKLDEGITYSKVNFPEKKIDIKFLNSKTSLRKIAELLDSLGYEPVINFDVTDKEIKTSHLKKLYYKIGVAGFAFGNIMLLSFPEYLGLEKTADPELHKFFGYMNLLLALPVFFYSSSEYYISAYKGLKNKILNIDFPLFLGIFVTFIRSAFEILTQSGAGYMDSMTGLVFFLLVGKVFQSKTYNAMSFERTYKSYFPLSVTLKKGNSETTIPISKLKIGDRIIIRNGELIPADSILFLGDGNIDYSFVTGESIPVTKVLGEMLYAGGRQFGGAIEVEIIKEVSQSYLTNLWNNDIFKKSEVSNLESFSNTISKYFTLGILILALVGAAVWMPVNFNIAVNVFTAILIVACPCALALAIPFTFGNVMRIFGRNKFYIKNTNVIENLAKINSIVFDKTGTLTENQKTQFKYSGEKLDDFNYSIIMSLVGQSIHPLCKVLYYNSGNFTKYPLINILESTGKGIKGEYDNHIYKIGSLEYLFENNLQKNILVSGATTIHIMIDGKYFGYFSFNQSYRENITELADSLEKNYELHLLSGDNESEKLNLRKIFKEPIPLYFKQTPESKMKYIKILQNEGQGVMMVGDGLNDAGALKQSDVGISISEDVSNFSPACDGILNSESFSLLPEILKFSKDSIRIIIISFVVFFIYNIFAIGIAFQGLLKPIVAAILMPVSSISVVVFSVLLTNYISGKRSFK